MIDVAARCQHRSRLAVLPPTTLLLLLALIQILTDDDAVADGAQVSKTVVAVVWRRQRRQFAEDREFVDENAELRGGGQRRYCEDGQRHRLDGQLDENGIDEQFGELGDKL